MLSPSDADYLEEISPEHSEVYHEASSNLNITQLNIRSQDML